MCAIFQMIINSYTCHLCKLYHRAAALAQAEAERIELERIELERIEQERLFAAEEAAREAEAAE